MNNTYQETEQTDVLENIVHPPIYSKKAIWGFSFFFTPLFGGILLMQNLKDIGKKKEANVVLLVSLLITALVMTIIVVFDIQNRLITFGCNVAGAALLSEYFHKKYFPDEADYEKKKIWKPLIIGILICVAFIFFVFWAQDQVTPGG